MYVGSVVYSALTALGLEWSLPLMPSRLDSSSCAPLTGLRLATDPGELVILRRRDVWAAVSTSPAWLTDRSSRRPVDLRYDAGLVRLKVRHGGAWVDLLPLAPRTCGTVPDSLAPRLLAGGTALVPHGAVTRSDSVHVQLSVRFGGRAATLNVRLLARGAELSVRGPRHARYRLGLLVERRLRTRRTRSGLVTPSVEYRFSPRARIVRRRTVLTSAEARLHRYDVMITSGRDGLVRWRIELRPIT